MYTAPDSDGKLFKSEYKNVRKKDLVLKNNFL